MASGAAGVAVVSSAMTTEVPQGATEVLIPTNVLGLPQLLEIDKRPAKKFRRSYTGAPVAAGGRENKYVSLVCSLVGYW